MVLALLAMGLSIGLTVAAYFTWNEVQQLTGTQSKVEAQVEDRVQPLRASLDDVNKTMQASLSTFNQSLQNQRRQMDQQLKKLGEDQRNVGHRVRVLAALIGRSEQGWSLAEVEYLLRIANQRLQLQRDVDTAEQALKAADQRLHDLADPHFLSVREQIARDLEAVQAVSAVDIEGISLSLSAALAGIDQLSVAGSRYQPAGETEPEASETRATISDWRELPRLLWSTLSGLFRIREHDKPVTPMLTPQREYFLRENLRLQLSAARLALLRDDSVQYQVIVATAQDWLSAYFAGDDGKVNDLVSQLEQLKAINTVPQLPDISGSLRVLRQQMKLSEQQDVLPLVPDQPEPEMTEPSLEETPEESDEGAAS
jgi:uroporphyrin-3 C-methyltransferase